MIPAGVEQLGCTVTHDLRTAVEGADAVVMLRIQHERIGDPLIPNTREYSRLWGLNAKKAREWLKPAALILHPGPINRGVELSPDVADGPHSVILDQVQNGVAVRMPWNYQAGQDLKEEIVPGLLHTVIDFFVCPKTETITTLNMETSELLSSRETISESL